MRFLSALASVAALMATTAMGKPIALAEPVAIETDSWEVPEALRPLNHVEIRNPMAEARAQYKEKRLSTDVDLSISVTNQPLFSGTIGAVTIDTRCVDCHTEGVLHLNLTNHNLDSPRLRLDFEGVKAYMDMGIKVSTSNTFTLNLFTLNSPIGVGTSEINVGVLLFIDLVLDITSELDMTGGFYVELPQGAFIETGLFEGKIYDSSFQGVGINNIPVTVQTANAQLKAALRVRVQAGVEVDAIGASAVVAVYANLVEFVMDLTYTENCYIEAAEHFNLNIGAYVHLGIFQVDLPVPTISTTLFRSPTLTQCLVQKAPASTAVATTTHAPTTTPAKAKALGIEDGMVTSAPSVRTGAPNIFYANATVISADTPAKGGMTAAALVTASVSNAVTAAPSTTFTITICGAHFINCPTEYQQVVTVTRALAQPTDSSTPSVTTLSAPEVGVARIAATGTTSAPAAKFIFPVSATPLEPLATPIVNTLSLDFAIPTPDQHSLAIIDDEALIVNGPIATSAPILISSAISSSPAVSSSSAASSSVATTSKVATTSQAATMPVAKLGVKAVDQIN